MNESHSSMNATPITDACVETSFFNSGTRLPIVLTPTAPISDLPGWIDAHRDQLETWLSRHGAILFRDFGLPGPADFEAFAEAISPALYGEYGDLPKKEGGRNTYRSTPYPEQQMILYHNESSHLSRWPRRQFFFCGVSRTQAKACDAVSKMGEGLPKSACRSRLQ